MTPVSMAVGQMGGYGVAEVMRELSVAGGNIERALQNENLTGPDELIRLQALMAGYLEDISLLSALVGKGASAVETLVKG
jgi:hypothetical protein